MPADTFSRHFEVSLDLGVVGDLIRGTWRERGRPSVDPTVLLELQLVMSFGGGLDELGSAWIEAGELIGLGRLAKEGAHEDDGGVGGIEWHGGDLTGRMEISALISTGSGVAGCTSGTADRGVVRLPYERHHVSYGRWVELCRYPVRTVNHGITLFEP